MIVCVPSSLKPNIQSSFLTRCNGERMSTSSDFLCLQKTNEIFLMPLCLKLSCNKLYPSQVNTKTPHATGAFCSTALAATLAIPEKGGQNFLQRVNEVLISKHQEMCRSLLALLCGK